MKTFFYIFLSLILLSLIGCRQHPHPEISFYYWKTNFAINQDEQAVLQKNNVKELYVRYFDVVIENNMPQPIASITVDSFPANTKIIPVIFIKNKVFETMGFSPLKNDTSPLNKDSISSNKELKSPMGLSPLQKKEIDKLASNVFKLISLINDHTKINTDEIQFDCDWTEKTKDYFFEFLKSFKKISNKTLSATIRLHQIKFSHITGVPPVDKAVLMYYNMGSIDATQRNSIYERKIALKYILSLKNYPLPLDIALPIFSWGIQSSEGKVVALLNKTYPEELRADSNCIAKSNNTFMVKQSHFYHGFYFKENDLIQIENIKENQLIEMAKDLKIHLAHTPTKIIFYDFDNQNFKQYEKNIFKKIVHRF